MGKIPDSQRYAGELEISQEAMDEIVENISSPVEIAALLKAVGVPYSKNYLASTDFVDSYNLFDYPQSSFSFSSDSLVFLDL